MALTYLHDETVDNLPYCSGHIFLVAMFRSSHGRRGQ